MEKSGYPVGRKSEIHLPVLFDEILEQARETAEDLTGDRNGLQSALDATFGRGGHSRGLLREHSHLKLTGLDQDPAAHAFIESDPELSGYFKQGRLSLHKMNFEDISLARFPEPFDFILFDLGVSSPQLDTPERGFSFYHDGPLDMRMDLESKRTAADVVNSASADALMEMFKNLGEVENPFKVVRAIVKDRESRPFHMTKDLSSLIERVDGWHKKGHHPATKYFMALRMFVNRELEVIEAVLPKALECLRPGGRMAVITFHSLEDRIVKQFFRSLEDATKPDASATKSNAQGESVRRKAIQPTLVEVEKNSRARSAKLRVFRRFKIGESKSPKNKYAHLIGSKKNSTEDSEGDI